MSNEAVPQIVSDVLYGISLRPQELALFADHAQFQLRYSPIFDDPAQKTTEHFKLLVVEISCQLPPDMSVGRSQGQDLELLRCGWQLELKTSEACRPDSLVESEDELPMLLEHMAACVNRLAGEAQVDAPLPEETIQRLVKQYRQKHG